MCVHRFGKPHAALEAECLISKGAYRASVNHVTRKIIVDCLLYVSTDFGLITTTKYTVNTVVCKLIGNISATIAQNAASHVQLDLITNVYLLKRPSIFFIASSRSSMLICQIL